MIAHGIFLPPKIFVCVCGSFLKNFLLNLLWYCFCYMFWVFLAKRYLGSLYPDQGSNLYPCIGRRSLNHWVGREVPPHMLFPKLLKGAFCGENLCFVLCVIW